MTKHSVTSGKAPDTSNTVYGRKTYKGTKRKAIGKKRKVLKKKKYSEPSYKIYIYKVLKKMDNSAGINKTSVNAMNFMLKDLFCRISEESSRLLRLNRRNTCTSKEILSATKIIAPTSISNDISKTVEMKLYAYNKTLKNDK